MKRVITPENLDSFAYVNFASLTGAPRGLVLEFMGLGGSWMSDGTGKPLGTRLGSEGILYAIPYLDPWNWMDPAAVRETDEIVDAIFERVGLSSLPVVSSGGSMGGLCCLTYARYAARPVSAVVANCPVCDLPYHYTERPDLPRTLYAAFSSCGFSTLDEALRSASPLHLAQAGELPSIPYTLFHCTRDEAVNKEMHTDRLEKAMKGHYDITVIPVPDRGHCDLTDEAREAYTQALIRGVSGK